MHDPAAEAVRRSSMMSGTRDLPGDGSMRSGSVPYAGVGPSPSPGQYNAHMVPHFQPVTPVAAPPQIHQTPVPIPHPPHHVAPPTASTRPMQYQQQQPGFSQSYAANYAQSPAPPLHQQQQMNTPMGGSFSQVPVPPVSRGSVSAAPGNAMTPGNMYNPPRPPEVYTLPDNLNENFPPEVRQCFQHDAAGRVLFFTAPPLDRPHKGVAPESAGLGHSVKYLAGRKEWLADRERKRKERDETRAAESQKRVERDSEEERNSQTEAAFQATESMGKWLHNFDDDTKRWTKEAGLEGWQSTGREEGVA